MDKSWGEYRKSAQVLFYANVVKSTLEHPGLWFSNCKHQESKGRAAGHCSLRGCREHTPWVVYETYVEKKITSFLVCSETALFLGLFSVINTSVAVVSASSLWAVGRHFRFISDLKAGIPKSQNIYVSTWEIAPIFPHFHNGWWQSHTLTVCEAHKHYREKLLILRKQGLLSICAPSLKAPL